MRLSDDRQVVLMESSVLEVLGQLKVKLILIKLLETRTTFSYASGNKGSTKHGLNCIQSLL